MTKLGVPQQSQSQQLGLTMNNVHLSNVPYEIHPMQLKVSNKCQHFDFNILHCKKFCKFIQIVEVKIK